MDLFFFKDESDLLLVDFFPEIMGKERGQLKNCKGLGFQRKFWGLWLKQASTALFLSSPAFDITYTKTNNSIKYNLWEKTMNFISGLAAGIQTCLKDE